MREYVLVLLVAAAVTYLLTPLVRRGGIAVGALKVPRSRDVHSKPTPTLGGIAMYCGMAAGLLVADRLSYLHQAFTLSGEIPGLMLAGGVLMVVGFIDDRWGMGAITKLAGQVAAGGVLVWSGVSMAWIPLPNGELLTFDPLESYTLTIAIIVVTINAVNFVDGLDGLAAGVVAVAALSFLAYSYTLLQTLGISRQFLPAVVSAVLAGMCLGFLPHNFHPARIFMGDTGAMLLGLLLAYGPISSTGSLDPSILTNYQQQQTLNRYALLIPLLLPAAILIIPYTDLVLAVVRRYWRGKSPFAADSQHLHHRLLNIGHSQRQSVLIMYLWAALFSGTVVALSLIRTGLIWLAVVTVVATLALVPATVPRLRPWGVRKSRARPVSGTPARAGASVSAGAAAVDNTSEAAYGRNSAAVPPFTANGDRAAADHRGPPAAPFPAPGPFPAPDPFPGPDPLPVPDRFRPPDWHSDPDGFPGHDGFRGADGFPRADGFQGTDRLPSTGPADELPDLPPGWPSPPVRRTPRQ